MSGDGQICAEDSTHEKMPKGQAMVNAITASY